MKVQSISTFAALLLIGCVAGAQTDTKFPSQITTSDGKLYNGAEKLRVDPDGILVSYQPVERGIGLAKLKFRDLPDDLQKQYGYDPKSAAEYEKQQAQAAEQWRSPTGWRAIVPWRSCTRHWQAMTQLLIRSPWIPAARSLPRVLPEAHPR